MEHSRRGWPLVNAGRLLPLEEKRRPGGYAFSVKSKLKPSAERCGKSRLAKKVQVLHNRLQLALFLFFSLFIFFKNKVPRASTESWKCPYINPLVTESWGCGGALGV